MADEEQLSSTEELIADMNALLGDSKGKEEEEEDEATLSQPSPARGEGRRVRHRVSSPLLREDPLLPPHQRSMVGDEVEVRWADEQWYRGYVRDIYGDGGVRVVYEDSDDIRHAESNSLDSRNWRVPADALSSSSQVSVYNPHLCDNAVRSKSGNACAS